MMIWVAVVVVLGQGQVEEMDQQRMQVQGGHLGRHFLGSGHDLEWRPHVPHP